MLVQRNRVVLTKLRQADLSEAPWWLRVCGRDWLAPFVLVAVCLCLYVPGQMLVPPLDRDEPRFAQASKQMMETGNYVSIHYQEQARNKKPIGIYWLQAGAAKLLGYGRQASIWVYRLPSVFGGIAAVLLTYWMARALFMERAAFVAALLVAFALILNVESRLAKTDAMLLVCVMLSQGALLRIWISQQKQASWLPAFLFWAGLASGVLIKGPIILLVCGLTILALILWEKRISWLLGAAPISGFLLFAAIVSPWLLAIYLETDGAFFRDSLGGDLWSKVGAGKEAHGAPPLTHLLLSLLIFWPVPSFLLVFPCRNRQVLNARICHFLLCWLVPVWVVFELSSTKLPHYTLPMMPAFALLAVEGILANADRPVGTGWRYTSAVLFLLVPLGVLAAVVVVPLLLGVWPSPPGVVLCGFAVVVAVIAARHFLKGAFVRALPAVGGTAFLMFVGFWAFAAPALTPIWISSRLVEAVERIPECDHKEVATTGFYEPSLVFLLGTDTKLLGAEAAARFLAEGKPEAERGCRVALVEARQLERFEAEALQVGMKVSEVSRVSGVNINGGKNVLVYIFVANGAAQ